MEINVIPNGLLYTKYCHVMESVYRWDLDR
jgi:hypothetical protein